MTLLAGIAALSAIQAASAAAPISLSTGHLYIPESYHPRGPEVNLVVHFHSSPERVRECLDRSGIDAALVTVSFDGLSGVYTRPFRDDPQLFGRIVDEAKSHIAKKLGVEQVTLRRLIVSSFSAGFGAVREILRSPEYSAAITDLVLADTLYAGYDARDGAKVVDPEDMAPFEPFVDMAARGEKTVWLTFSQVVPPGYASTRETAEYLLDKAGAKLEPASGEDAPGLRLNAAADVGRFHVRSYDGDDGPAHMKHLYSLDRFYARLPGLSRPRLLLSREGVQAVKDRIARHDWARRQWESVKARADGFLERPVELPPRGGNWSHWYACPEHGAPLKTGTQIGPWQWEHICTVGGETLAGDSSKASTDYDGCRIGGIHSELCHAVRDLGLAYQVTGERRFAARAREILLGYAARYRSYPLHNVHGEPKVGGGRIGAQSLDEAVRLIPLAQGADLIWETLDSADRSAVIDDLLMPAVTEVILPHELGIHNIQCWKNSAVGLVGLLADNDELVINSIDDPERGWRAQMAKGVLPDGTWWEGAWGYHFYTLSALWPLAEAARNCGIDLYGGELRSMYDAPLMFAMPNLRLPAFNDSTEVNLAGQAPTYELAYARYSRPDYVSVAAAGGRKGDFALLFGADELPEPPVQSMASANYPRSGYAVLARGAGERATWLCLKYGPHGGGHGHPDKLSFVLYSGGEVLGVDPGTARYGLPIQKGWYRTTFAHNTLTVDESSQKQAEGSCIAFDSLDGIDYLIAEAGSVYDGVRFTRSAALLDEKLVLVIDSVLSDTERLLDVAYHQRGAWENLPDAPQWRRPDRPGYSYLRDTQSVNSTDGVSLSARTPSGASVGVCLAAGEPTEVITGTGVGAHSEDRVPVVVFRRRAQQSTFAWLIDLEGGAALQLLSVEPRDGGPSAAVRVTAGRATWDVLSNPDSRSVVVRLPDGSEWRTSDQFAVRAQTGM